MKTKTVAKGGRGLLILILLLPAIIAPLAAFGVSYPAPLYHQKERHDRFVKDDTVYMFHSGIDEVKKTIHVNDTLAVYRVTQNCEAVSVGTVKVVSFVGETYLRGEVLAGEIRPDDIAKKDSVSCLIISAAICHK